MPTYEYECENKHRFEKWQSMKDDPLKECLECGAPVRRILHPAGIIFKGSGWYITDSRKGGSSDSDAAKKDSKTDAKTDAKSDSGDSKTDTKSEAKSDTKSEGKADTGSAKSETKATSSE